MIEEDFYATIKFKNGEEIFCKVSPSDEGEKTLLLISNPIVVEEIKNKTETVGYKIEPWMKTSTEDLLVVNLDDVLTMTESNDVEMVMLHQDYTTQLKISKGNKTKLDSNMGYISNVSDAKKLLEKIFKDS